MLYEAENGKLERGTETPFCAPQVLGNRALLCTYLLFIANKKA
jgi:hypothetical protein